MIFSVVVPTHNRLETLKICLAALKSQRFSGSDYEVIVVDDGSQDGTLDYLKSIVWEQPNLKVFSQRNMGPAAARNLGIRSAIGQIIAFTDDDCLVGDDWLSRLYAGYQDFPQAAGMGGYLEAPKEVLGKSVIARLEYFETHVIYKAGQEAYLGGFESPAGGTNNISYLKRVIDQVGLFDEGFPVPAGEDADFKLRVVAKGYKIGYIPLKVAHLDPYSLRSFMRRSINHGIGSAFFESKHHQSKNLVGILVGFFLWPRVFVKSFRSSQDLALSLLMTAKDFLMNIGRFRYWSGDYKE